MARYRHLSLVEREELSRMLAAGDCLRAVGRALHRAPSTLSRELARHHASPITYRAVRAHHWGFHTSAVSVLSNREHTAGEEPAALRRASAGT